MDAKRLLSKLINPEKKEMNKKAYIIPETIVVKMETELMHGFSSNNPKGAGDPIVDSTPDDTDEPIRSRGFCDWGDEDW
jgi:hypothetical protein